MSVPVFYAWLVGRDITDTPSRLEASTLAEAKREASAMLGKGFAHHSICLGVAHVPDASKAPLFANGRVVPMLVAVRTMRGRWPAGERLASQEALVAAGS